MQSTVWQAETLCSHILAPMLQRAVCLVVAGLLSAEIGTPWSKLACSAGSALCRRGLVFHVLSRMLHLTHVTAHVLCRELDGPFWQDCSSLQAAPLLLAAFQDLRNADDLAFRHASAQVSSCPKSCSWYALEHKSCIRGSSCWHRSLSTSYT